MRPAIVLWSALTGVGMAGTVIPAYVIMRGPFFDGPLLEPMQLLYALLVFMVGIFLFAGAGAKLYASSGSEKRDMPLLEQKSANQMER